ncbi:hypothetical protein Q7P37_009578 [Cladosporium fusiforme]
MTTAAEPRSDQASASLLPANSPCKMGSIFGSEGIQTCGQCAGKGYQGKPTRSPPCLACQGFGVVVKQPSDRASSQMAQDVPDVAPSESSDDDEHRSTKSS